MLSCVGGLSTFIARFWMEEWDCYFSLHRLLDLLDHIFPRHPQFLKSPFTSSKNTIIINTDTRGGSVVVIILPAVWYRFSQPGSKCASWILIKGIHICKEILSGLKPLTESEGKT